MLERLIYLDIGLTNFFRNLLPQNYFFDWFFSFFSLKGNAIFVWILVIIIVLLIEEKKHPGISKNDKKFVVIFTISFLITSFIVEYPLKNLFQRQRPIANNSNQSQSILTQCPTSFSFPSGHAATAFAASAVLTFFDKKRRFFYYIVAFLIGYSRIYLGCHYFLDVLGGGVLGIVVSNLILLLFMSRKYFK